MNFARSWLIRLVRFLRRQWEDLARQGWRGWVFAQASRRGRWLARVFGHRLWPRGLKKPIFYRPGTSDLDVYTQVFDTLEYRCLDHVISPGLIIDCGANVGFTSAYLLSRHPSARVIAVEPDASNYLALRANLAQFGVRV